TNSPMRHLSAFANRRSVSSVGLSSTPVSSWAIYACFIFMFLASSTCVRPRALRSAFKFIANVLGRIIMYTLYSRQALFQARLAAQTCCRPVNGTTQMGQDAITESVRTLKVERSGVKWDIREGLSFKGD